VGRFDTRPVDGFSQDRPMDFVAVLIAVAFIGVMVALVEGIDRI
jgi:hypothetical protein